MDHRENPGRSAKFRASRRPCAEPGQSITLCRVGRESFPRSNKSILPERPLQKLVSPCPSADTLPVGLPELPGLARHQACDPRLLIIMPISNWRTTSLWRQRFCRHHSRRLWPFVRAWEPIARFVSLQDPPRPASANVLSVHEARCAKQYAAENRRNCS